MWVQRSEEVEEDVAEKGRFFEIGICSEERREERVFHRFSAAVSAASIDSVWSGGVDATAVMELVAMSAFCSLIRVFSSVSKVVRCFLMARPFSMSAFKAFENDAATDFCSSAIILRRAARSSALGSSDSSLLLLSSLSLPTDCSSSSSSI